jgi:hypothetical protein
LPVTLVGMDDEVQRLLGAQEGVVSRRQLVAVGHDDVAIARMLRRRQLFVIHIGVYLNHNGPPTWLQRAWAAVLYAEPAALFLESARRDACGSRRTTAARLVARLEARARIPRRGWLLAVLEDVARGTCSVLEHGDLDRVVRPHGLPVGVLQAARLTGSGFVVRDVEHADLELAVELDSALFHSSPADRDRDLDRDLVAAVEQDLRTVRLGWRQVFRDSCRTASLVAVLMQRLGWTGQSTRCPACPETTGYAA